MAGQWAVSRGNGMACPAANAALFLLLLLLAHAYTHAFVMWRCACSFADWKSWACDADNMNLTPEVAWVYFETFDLISEPGSAHRLKLTKREHDQQTTEAIGALQLSARGRGGEPTIQLKKQYRENACARTHAHAGTRARPLPCLLLVLVSCPCSHNALLLCRKAAEQDSCSTAGVCSFPVHTGTCCFVLCGKGTAAVFCIYSLTHSLTHTLSVFPT